MVSENPSEYGWWGGMPNFSPDTHLQVAQTGSESDRAALVGQGDLDPAALDVLLADESENVLRWLAGNTEIPSEALAILAERSPQLSAIVALNANAPAKVKEHAPLGELSSYSIATYLEQKDADYKTRVRFVAIRDENGHPGDATLTLGRAWDQALRPER